MDLASYLRVVRKRWRIIVSTALLMVCAAAALTLLTPRKYESTVQFFVSTADSSTNAQLAQGGTFTQQRVKSYTELIATPKVLGPVAQQLNIEDVSALSKQVTATAPPDTVLIEAAVTDRSPQRAFQIAQALGRQFPQTISEIERVSATQPSPIKVTTVREPTVNDAAVSPRPTRNLALALVLGLVLGLGLALLRDRLDNRVRTKEDLEALTESPVIGVIPFDSDASDHPLIVRSDAHSSRSEAFRSLRTNLQFLDAANHPRSIVVTSSLAGEGKSTTTANLALAIAESGASVCLIEGDLRRPRLLQYLGLEGGVGITDVLIERVDLADVLQPFGEHQLAVIGAGAIPPNPSELLGSQSMRDVIARLAERFTYVIIDAPPLLPVTDAAVLGALTDGVILISGSSLVTDDQVDTALDSLEQVNANVLGVVLNRAPRKKRSAYDYRYYDYRPEAQETKERSQRRRSGRATADAGSSGS